MGNVIDFFSGKPLDAVEQDYETNDQVADSVGRYVGVLPKPETAIVREAVDQIVRKRVQIETLTKEFNKMYEDYAYLMAGVLAFLRVDDETFDPDRTDVYVDEKGHTWLVDLGEREEFYKQRMENKES